MNNYLIICIDPLSVRETYVAACVVEAETAAAAMSMCRTIPRIQKEWALSAYLLEEDDPELTKNQLLTRKELEKLGYLNLKEHQLVGGKIVNNKKLVRKHFREETFKRDNYQCRGCSAQYTKETAEEHLDAHHINPRENMPNGGYVKENGISLCKHGNPSCHIRAELWLNGSPDRPQGFSPEQLYATIGSSFEEAWAASMKLL